MEKVRLIATTTFGLEATVKREVAKLGFSIAKTSDGRIEFEGDVSAICKANLWLRSADRVLLMMGEFEAKTFDSLFEQTKALPWEEWIPKDGKFTVTGKSISSQLFSVPDCQAIVKKAVVEKLKQRYHLEWFPETGASYTIQVALLKDIATITIDTTGPGLHKRGYREEAMLAPIKETLAAAMLELSYWRKDRCLLDPFCGSGTIPIEAAMMATNRAPGLSRNFASEDWEQIGKPLWQKARTEAFAAISTTQQPNIFASDIDKHAVELAKRNAQMAGVEDCISFSVSAVSKVSLPEPYGVMVTNPPYGERMGEKNELKRMYEDLKRLFAKNTTWSIYVITSDETFESHFGRLADAKRKLFNGTLKTNYYQFFGEKPKRH